jgi:hypothetical protein
VPLARPVYIAYALVSVTYHWNNFLWPLIITNSVESRPLTVGLQVFSSTDQGIDWSIITAATLLTTAPLLIGFLLFQRQFVQSFMRAGIDAHSLPLASVPIQPRKQSSQILRRGYELGTSGPQGAPGRHDRCSARYGLFWAAISRCKAHRPRR